MSDILGLSDTGSSFDVTNLDSNIQRISAVERTWRAPKLPEETKLDLAMMPGVNPEGLTSFLQQIDTDLSGETEPPVEEDPPEPPAPKVNYDDEDFGTSGVDVFRKVFADVGGEKAPTSPTVDAVKRFKMKAIEGGYLDAPDGIVDSSWSPELNNIRYEMAFDEYDSKLRGDRYGAVDARNFIDVLGEWTQPSSLLSAATELDLWWDFGSVGKEFSSWGDKFRKLEQADNPWEWGKSLVDAITGPVDDIVMPIVNWGLIASGVGGVYSTAKLGAMAGRAGRLGKVVEGLYDTSKLRSAANLTAIAEPSWTAVKLGKSGSATARAIGGALESWRAYTPVSRTKQAVQAGMRLGFTAQAEDLLPGYQGGKSLSDVTAIGDAASRVKEMGMNPIFMPVELALAPYNIFSPGTFLGKSGSISKTGSGLYKFVGSDPGRAAAGAVVGAGVGTVMGEDVQDVALGALTGAALGVGVPRLGRAGQLATQRTEALLAGTTFRGSKKIGGVNKFIGHVSDFLETTSFVPVANDQRVSTAFDRVVRKTLQPDELKRYEGYWQESGATLTSVVAKMEGVDEEAAAAMVTWRMMTASLDATAMAQAKMISGGSTRQRYHNFRNALTGQLTTFDLEDLSAYRLEEIVTAATLSSGKTPGTPGFMKMWNKLFEKHSADPSGLFELANTHNENARRTLADLVENLDEEALYSHMAQTGDTFGNWSKFTSADSQISDLLQSGLLDQAEFRGVVNRKGNASKWRQGAPRKASATRIIHDSVANTVLLDDAVDINKLVTNKNLSTLVQQDIEGVLTVAKHDTATAQDLFEESEKLKRLKQIREGLEGAAKYGVDWRKVQDAAGAPLSTLNENQIKAALSAVTGKTKFSTTAGDLIALAQSKGIDPLDFIDTIDDQIRAVVDDADMWTKMGLDARVAGKDGVHLEGMEALKARLSALDEKIHYTASEIDVANLVQKLTDQGNVDGARRVQELADGLERDGYKLVHGKEFIMPHQLNTGFKPFEDISRRHLNAETFGNVFRRRLPAEAKLIEDRRHRTAMAATLGKALGKDLRADDKLVENVLSDLHVILENLQEDSAKMVDRLWQENWFRRRLTALDTSTTPLRPDDMQNRKKQIEEGLVAMGYDRDVAEAAWLASTKMRNTDFQDTGLYGIEAWLRSQNQGAGILKFVSGGKSNGLISGRNAYTAAGGYAGWQIGGDMGPEGEDGNLGAKIVGGLAGAAAGNVAARGLTKAVNATDGPVGALLGKADAEIIRTPANAAFPEDTLTTGTRSLMRRVEMNQHGYMADSLVRIRDTMRFTLSPFFDISRYTEGLMLAQTATPLRAADGTKMAVHLNMSPTALRKRYIKDALQGVNPSDANVKAREWFDRSRDEFRAAARGDFDPDVLDSASRWFAQIGIAGFNPTDWMTAAFIELKHVGNLDNETAYKAVKEMYTYGTGGRSAAELSVNFVFFPFSFQKKALTHIGKWMNSDLGRSIIIHDAMKTYEILDERYNLNEYWRDHAPALEMLNKLNLFAYGISPGRLGGINRPMIEPFVNMGTNYAQALFMPQGASIKDAAGAAEWQSVYKSLVPALNDINWMVEDAKQQINVATNGQTLDAEIRMGYEEWNDYKQEMAQSLDARGLTFGDLRNKPFLAKEYANYELKRAELADKYPAWFDSRTKSTQNRIALEMEKNDRLARAEQGVEVSASDMALYETESLLKQLKYEGELRGMDLGGSNGWEDAPAAVFSYVHQFAQRQLAQNPAFRSIWEKFYRKEFGPLEAQV